MMLTIYSKFAYLQSHSPKNTSQTTSAQSYTAGGQKQNTNF